MFKKLKKIKWSIPNNTLEMYRNIIYKVLNNKVNYKFKLLALFSYLYQLFMIITITISILLLILSTEYQIKTWSDDNGNIFGIFEVVIISIFLFDYIVRFVCCKYPFKFLFNFLNVIDILSILPFFIELMINDSNISALAVLRLFRLFRVFKMTRHSQIMQMFFKAIKRAQEGIIFLIFLMGMFIIFFGTCVYYAEISWCNQDQYGNWIYFRGDLIGEITVFQSIPRSMWWCLVTLTTVGYGDMFPVTVAGKIVASITMICSLITIAFPVTLLASAFSAEADEYMTKKIKKEKLKLTEQDVLQIKIDDLKEQLKILENKQNSFLSYSIN